MNKSIKIFHTSDLHSDLMKIVHNKIHLIKSFDVWVDTGDFFPNDPVLKLGSRYNIVRVLDKDHEVQFQKEWLVRNNILEHITNWLDGRPFISVSGNHDFISLSNELKEFGCPNVFEINLNCFELFGLRWSGFPNINYISGEWNYETSENDLFEVVRKMGVLEPDILVTHSPPFEVLDCGGDFNNENFGIKILSSFLSEEEHKIKHHFFGHVHESGNKVKNSKEIGIKFYNGARTAKLHTIEGYNL
jgi:Icc-related predicted phosphoesterase